MKNNAPHHLIFEGAEMTGKSYVISEIYNFLEQKYSSKKFPHLLDGCHWINCDVGIFGTEYGPQVIKNYIELAETLKEKNIIFEKFHISDRVYADSYLHQCRNYKQVEEKLISLNFKIIFLEVDMDVGIWQQRLSDRLKLYPHYKRIAQKPTDYLVQQMNYVKHLSSTKLPVLKINSSKLPNKEIINKILKWLKEK